LCLIFFIESASIEYNIERDCNLTQIGGLLDNKGYGIATRKGIKIINYYNIRDESIIIDK
jgi:hypothetical protein